MKHYQEQFVCGGCKRVFVVDITSIGTNHQQILGVTCLKCAEEAGGRILKKGEAVDISSWTCTN